MNTDNAKSHSESVALLALLTIGSLEARQGKYCSAEELKARLKQKYAPKQ
jgi:hypothetical protein